MKFQTRNAQFFIPKSGHKAFIGKRKPAAVYANALRYMTLTHMNKVRYKRKKDKAYDCTPRSI